MRNTLRTLLAVLVLAASASLAVGAPVAADDGPAASVRGTDAVLRAGCQQYPVDWTVQLSDPQNTYVLRYTLTGPRGQVQPVSIYDDEGPRGRELIRICESTNGPGTYRIAWTYQEETPQVEPVRQESGSSTFVLSRRPKASVSLAGSRATEVSRTRVRYALRTLVRAGGRPVADRRLRIYVPRRPGSGWARHGSMRTDGQGRATARFVSRQGVRSLPERVRVKVCVDDASLYRGTCTISRVRVR